jgi:Do/DeqQ family serine protease
MSTPRILLPLIALLAACSGPVDTRAQSSNPAQLAEPTRHTPGDAATMKASFAPVVKRTAPAVVNVYARRVVRQQVDPFWQMFGGGVPGMPRSRVEQSLGSGVLVRSDGVVVTNNHVVEGGQEFMVVLNDRREFPAQVLLADPRTDLAVLKIDTKGARLPVLAIADRADTQVGDLVLAIGNPFGVGQTVTNGIISALNRTEGDTGGGAFIQTDAAINPGNSGGALVNMDGDLIGINSQILSRSGTSTGVGFAIPAAMVRRVVETAVGGARTLVRPWIGAKTDPVTSDVASSLGLGAPQGALVTDLWAGGPGQKAGLKLGDIIVAVDGGQVDDPANLNFRVATKRPGEAVKLDVLRSGKRQTVTAQVQAPPGGKAEERLLQGEQPLSGVQVATLSPAVADELGLDPFSSGVMITRVSGRSYAAAAGFQQGDIVREINGRKVQTVSDLQEALAAGRGRGWRITIDRGGQPITGEFRG